MSEHDIAKHTKAIIQTAHDPNKKWKHKLGEILIEIGIIVFAVTLSLFVERWREGVHNREIEKKFLMGLRTDLQNDLQQQQEDSISYASLQKGWRYMRMIGMQHQKPEKDSIEKYSNSLFSGVGFIPNDSRFQALKSSGQLNVIENDSLQNLILDLYQNKIKTMQGATDYLTKFKTEQLMPFISDKMRIVNDTTTNISEVLRMPQMQNYLLFGNVSQEILMHYHDVMQQSRKIIELIDKQYE